MSPPVTTTDTFSPTTTTLTMTTAKIGDDSKEASDVPHIAAVPSFSLRSTAIYSPPHGDRVPSGRNELIKTDTSIFKYYLPENRSKPMVNNRSFFCKYIHTDFRIKYSLDKIIYSNSISYNFTIIK